MFTTSKTATTLFLSILLIFTVTTTESTTIWDQVNPSILKKINIEDPSEKEQTIITACHVLRNHGVQHPAIPSEIFQAITSVDLIPEILPIYDRSETLLGSIALATQIAQMKTTKAEVQQNIDRLHYLQSHIDVAKKLHSICNHTVDAVNTFLSSFKHSDEDEELLQEKINNQLYYKRFGLDKLNENKYALGFWTRANQFWTGIWYVLPGMLKKDIELSAKYRELSFKYDSIGIPLKEKPSKKELDDLKEQMEKDTIVGKNEADFYKYINNYTKEKIEKGQIKNSDDLSPLHIFLSICPKGLQILFKNFLAKTPEGIAYTPYFWKDLIVSAGTKTKQLCTTPVLSNSYNDNIKNLTKKTEFEWNSINKDWDSSTTWHTPSKKEKVMAAGITFAEHAWKPGLFSLYIYKLYSRYHSTKNLFDLVAEKQSELVDIAHLIRSMKKTCSIIKKHPELRATISQYDTIADLFNAKSSNHSDDLTYLVEALLSSSFDSESYLLSRQGNVLAIHHLFKRIKNELVPYMEAFGHIDAYIGTFRLLQEFQNHPNAQFCIPECIESETPTLIAQAYWHPLIDANKVITNDIEMGNSSESANFIITGPNAGGKTTSLMSLIINIIMAQSLGIAPSSSLKITPFARIHSYLDITTNLIEGESLFKAEVNRSKKLKQSINECQPGEKAFTIIDEIFSGTAPDVASDVGFKFAEQLGNAQHSMAVITTHFPRLKDLEEETTRFTNYKVADAHIDEQGNVTYPFKLVKGASIQNIAQHMLEHEGII